MKFKVLVLICFLLAGNISYAQETCPECEKFRIVGVYDFGPPPGGNWIILLLTVSEDLDSSFDPHYSDLLFVTNDGDTITKPMGPSYTLPQVQSDTIPFLMELNTEESNQNFPMDFNGKLLINTPTGSPCPPVTKCIIDYGRGTTRLKNETHSTHLSLVYPNPARDKISILTRERIKEVQLFNHSGVLLQSKADIEETDIIDLSNIDVGLLIIKCIYRNGQIETHQVMHIQ
jgi:hypothetical protein